MKFPWKETFKQETKGEGDTHEQPNKFEKDTCGRKATFTDDNNKNTYCDIVIGLWWIDC